MRRRPHSWEHIEGFRLDFRSCPAHSLLLNGPIVPLSVHTVRPLSLPMCISHHCSRHHSGLTGGEAVQHLLQAWGACLDLGLELSLSLKVVGSLLLMRQGDGAWAARALLDGSASLIRIGLVI